MKRREILKLIFGSLAMHLTIKPTYASENLFINLCNIAIAHEYGAIIQYINHSGIINNKRIDDILLRNMRDEVEHARGITRILIKEGAAPTIAAWPPMTGKELKDLLEEDIKGEEAAINLYSQILSLEESKKYRDSIASYMKKEKVHRERLIGILNAIKKS